MKKTEIVVRLVQQGTFIDSNGELPKTITTKSGKVVENKMIPVTNNEGDIKWSLLPKENSNVIELRNRYKKAYIYNLVNDANVIKRAILNSIKSDKLKKEIETKQRELVFIFQTSYTDNAGDHIYKFNTDTYFPSVSQNDYVDAVKKNLKYLTTVDNLWGSEKLIGVIHDVDDNGIMQVIRGLQLTQLGNNKNISDIAQIFSRYDAKCTQYYGDIKKNIKQLLAIASELTPKEQVEENLRKDMSNLLYYKTWTKVDYSPITLHLPEMFKYILPNSIINSKYLNTLFDLDNGDAFIKFKKYTPEWENDEIINYSTEDIKCNITEEIQKNVTISSRWIYKGDYHVLKAGNIVLNPANKYNAAAAMPDAKRTYHMVNKDYSWVSKFIDVDHDRYTNDELCLIIKYSVGDENTILELKYNSSYADYVINADRTHFESIGYKGKIYYRIIRDRRCIIDYDTSDDEFDDQDTTEDENDTIKKCPLYHNDADDIIEQYKNNYQVIGNYEYLVFELK